MTAVLQIPFRHDNSKDPAPERLSEPSLRCTPTLLSLSPPQLRIKPHIKEGIHVRTFGRRNGTSLEGLLCPRLWSLKISSLWTVPRVTPVCHCPQIPACKQPITLTSSLFPPSHADTGRGAHTYSPHLLFPQLFTLPGKLKLPRWIPHSYHVSLRKPGVSLRVYLNISVVSHDASIGVGVCWLIGWS